MNQSQIIEIEALPKLILTSSLLLIAVATGVVWLPIAADFKSIIQLVCLGFLALLSASAYYFSNLLIAQNARHEQLNEDLIAELEKASAALTKQQQNTGNIYSIDRKMNENPNLN